MAPTHTDILIAGAGIAGLSLAVALKRRLGALADVTLCDPALAPPPGPGRATLRAIALAPDMRGWLDALGLWQGLAAQAQPIRRMEITDSRLGAQPNPTYLSFAAERDGALAHMIVTADLRSALLAAAGETGVRFEAAALGALSADPHGIVATAADGRAWWARLLVAADGGRSRLRHAAGVQTIDRDYRQCGIVATLAHAEPHGGRAVQHFLPGGPLALLPLVAQDGSERRTSLVWTEEADEARRLAALPPADFLAAFEARAGLALGPSTLEDEPHAVPLRLCLARRLTAQRFALVGDAARVVHPLAGQGLNLGLRDAAALSEAVAAMLELGLDPGGDRVLQNYGRARSFDAATMAAATDGLNRLFSNDRLPLRVLRDIGLGLVDRAPLAKQLFIGNATGARTAEPAAR